MPRNPNPDIFLGFRAEEKVMELGQKHAANVSLILNKLQQAIAFKLDGNTKSCKKTVQEIAQLEGDADQLRRTMLRDLTTSALEAADRESLVRFAKALDRVADWANDAARILALVPLSDISKEFKSLFAELTQLLVNMGKSLQEATNAIVDDLDKAKMLGDKIEAAEKEIDEVYTKGLGFLLELGSTHSAAVVVLVRDLLHNLENTADTAEDAVDQLRIIILRHS